MEYSESVKGVIDISTIQDDRVYITFGDTKVQLSITHNDTGMSIDVFSQKEAEGIPAREYQIWFDDIHDEGSKL